MNKKELNEIKKRFNDDDYLLNVKKIYNNYVDASKTVQFEQLRPFAAIPENEATIFYEIAKKTLSGQLGKSLCEYPFPENETKLMLDCILDEKMSEKSISEIISKSMVGIDCVGPFMTTILYCTYSIPTKNKNDEVDTEADMEEYNFLIFSVSPMHTTNIGLYLNEKENKIEKKTNDELCVENVVTEGFVYPTFSGRTTDRNTVMHFSKTYKKPNKRFVTDILGCTYTLSSEDEKFAYSEILKDVFDDKLDFDKMRLINNKLEQVLNENRSETELPSIGEYEMEMIFKACGAKETEIEKLSASYKENIGEDTKLRVSNIVETSKTSIASSDIIINVKPSAKDRVFTETVNGQKCIVVPITDGNVEVNGIDVSI